MTSFRVLQFNMQFGQGWDEASPDAAPIDLDGTIAEIRRHRADIVLLQEVEQAHRDGSQPPQPPNYTALRHALTEFPHSHFALPPADPRELPFGIGLAIFSALGLAALFTMPVDWNSKCAWRYCGRALGPGLLYSPFPVRPVGCSAWSTCVNEYRYSPEDYQEVLGRIKEQGCPAP